MYDPDVSRRNPWETDETYASRVSGMRSRARSSAEVFRSSRDAGGYGDIPADVAFQLAADAAEFPDVTVPAVPWVATANTKAAMRDMLVSDYMNARMSSATAAEATAVARSSGDAKARFCAALARGSGTKASDVAASLENGSGGYVDSLYGMFR